MAHDKICLRRAEGGLLALENQGLSHPRVVARIPVEIPARLNVSR